MTILGGAAWLASTGCGDRVALIAERDAADAAAVVDAAIGDAGAADRATDDAEHRDRASDAASDGSGGRDSATAADAGSLDAHAGCIRGAFVRAFGSLHAHTGDSDGEGTPAEAFAHARDQAHLDIMAVTDHLEQLYDLIGRPSGEFDDCRAAAAAVTVSGSFLALCGFEYGADWSLAGSNGHIGVYFSDALLPQLQLQLSDFYDSLARCPDCIGQFNHPGDEATQDWNDFAYRADVDARINLFELSDSAGDPWSLLFDALLQGWRVAPTFNQDNHSANWGTADDGRSGFWLSALTLEALHQAMRERRSFATTDRNASIKLLADDCWMGSDLTGYPSATLTATVDDADGADGFTRIELYGPRRNLLTTQDCAGATSCTLTYPVPVTQPVHFVARATQADGDILVAAPIWLAP